MWVWSNETLREGVSVKKLIVSVLAITIILAAKAVVVQSGDNGPKLIHTEAVAQLTSGAATFGPVGPNCDANTGGSACAYLNSSNTGPGKSVPFGPYTNEATYTVFFGLNFANITASGPHDNAGNPIGFCAPISGTDTDTFSNGTLTTNFQGKVCCASTDCSNPLFGPPFVDLSSAVITGGTGRFAGATGGSSFSTSASTEGAPGLFHSEGVIQLP
jgi:hypothetical protein